MAKKTDVTAIAAGIQSLEALLATLETLDVTDETLLDRLFAELEATGKGGLVAELQSLRQDRFDDEDEDLEEEESIASFRLTVAAIARDIGVEADDATFLDALADLLRSDCPIDRKMRDQVCAALNRLTQADARQFSFPLLLPETELEVIRAPRE